MRSMKEARRETSSAVNVAIMTGDVMTEEETGIMIQGQPLSVFHVLNILPKNFVKLIVSF